MEISEQFVIIHDKYPKGRLHGLVIAREAELSGPTDLKASHLPLLQLMKVRAVS